MQTTITGKHLNVTPAIEEYIHRKTERIRKHFDRKHGKHAYYGQQPDTLPTNDLRSRTP